MADGYLTGRQVTDEFGFSAASLRRWANEGKLKGGVIRTPGGQRRYSRKAIEQLSNPQRPGTSERERYTELGTTGLTRFGGSVYEEKLRELRGSAGRIMYREMRLNDPVIGAVFFALSNALKQADWRSSPASERDPDKQAAEHIEQCLHDMSFTWADTLTFAIDPMLEQGFSLLEVCYKRRLGDNPPKYTDNPATSQYNDGRVGWRKWAPRPPESLAPGNEWDFDASGGIQGVNQIDANTGKPVYIPIEKLLHFRTSVHPANTPEPPPIHRAAYLPYWYSSNMQEIEGIGVERDLAGIPVIYLGNDRTLEGADSDYELAKKLVVNIRNDEQTGIVFPGPKMGGGATEGNGWLFELQSSGGQRQHDTGAIIERYDKRKALTVLAQFIMLGMEQVGSYALSRHQGDLFILAATAWIDSIAAIINRHAIPRLIKMNVFPGITGMPKLIPSPLGIPNLVAVAEYVNKLVDKEVLTPDDELERHLRQLADLPDLPEESEGVGRRGDRINLDKTALLLARLRNSLEPMEARGLVDFDETNELISPTLERLRHQIRGGTVTERVSKQEPGEPTAGEITNQLETDLQAEHDRLKRNIANGMAIAAALLLFRRNTESLLKRSYYEVWLTARGDSFNELEARQVEDYLSGSMEYLNGFADELEAGLTAVPTAERAGLLDSNLARTLMYAGGAWALYNRGKVYDKPKESMWRWEGPADSRSCEGCLAEVAAGARPLSEITRYPGDTECLTRCRHELVEVR